MGREAIAIAMAIAIETSIATAAGDPPTHIPFELRGDVSPAAASVRVESARVTVRGLPLRRGGVTVGVVGWDTVTCELTVRSDLDRTVRDVQMELVLGREAPVALQRQRVRGADGADEEGGEGDGDAAAMVAVPGWRFRVLLDELPPRAVRPVPCRGTLPPLEQVDRPDSPSQLTFQARVLGYRVPRLTLERALELVQRGTPADQRAALLGYGEEVAGDARAFDEQLLLGMLGALPGREARQVQRLHRAATRPVQGRQAPRSALEFAFLLRACRRIGGQPTLEGLIMNEQRLGETAPALPPRLDVAHPPENADLLPAAGFAAAVHEVIIDVARHNIAGLYLLLHPPPPPTPPPPPIITEAARLLAAAEGLDEPDAWLEAAAALPPDVPQFDPDTDREGRLPIVPIMAKYGGPEVMPALARALDAEELPLREEAARALARRGAAGVALLVPALDSEDERRRGPVSAALSSLEGEAGAMLVALARARGAVIEVGATGVETVAALERAMADERRRAVEAQLSRAEELAARDGADPAVGRALDEARALSPRSFTGLRERVARVAVAIYRARAAAGRPDAHQPLDDVARLGPIAGNEFAEAVRDLRIADARALAPRDLEAALRLLAPSDTRPAQNDATRAVAQELTLDGLDRALDGRDRPRAAALLDRARSLGAPDAALAPRARRLRAQRLVLPAAVGALVAALTGGALLLWARRRRRGRARVATAA